MICVLSKMFFVRPTEELDLNSDVWCVETLLLRLWIGIKEVSLHELTLGNLFLCLNLYFTKQRQ